MAKVLILESDLSAMKGELKKLRTEKPKMSLQDQDSKIPEKLEVINSATNVRKDNEIMDHVTNPTQDKRCSAIIVKAEKTKEGEEGGEEGDEGREGEEEGEGEEKESDNDDLDFIPASEKPSALRLLGRIAVDPSLALHKNHVYLKGTAVGHLLLVLQDLFGKPLEQDKMQKLKIFLNASSNGKIAKRTITTKNKAVPKKKVVSKKKKQQENSQNPKTNRPSRIITDICAQLPQ